MTNEQNENKQCIARSLIRHCSMLIALLLVVNIFFDSILGDYLKWDLTNTESNSIGDVSKSVLNNLDKDIEIVGLFELTPDLKKTTPYSYFVDILQDYV